MRDEQPQATDVATAYGPASMHATWAGVLRDAIRKESPNGISSGDLWSVLAEREGITDFDGQHQRAFHNALDYLADVGLARKSNNLWHEIPLFTRNAA